MAPACSPILAYVPGRDGTRVSEAILREQPGSKGATGPQGFQVKLEEIQVEPPLSGQHKLDSGGIVRIDYEFTTQNGGGLMSHRCSGGLP